MTHNPLRPLLYAALLLLTASNPAYADDQPAPVPTPEPNLIAPGAGLQRIATGFAFTEGPAPDPNGNVYFTDIPNNRIHVWSFKTARLTTFLENSQAANGLYFDAQGLLLACAGQARALVAFDSKGRKTVLADKFQGKRFNRPNDLWIDPKGGVYFTDPIYGQLDNPEIEGQHVYYLTPDRRTVYRVIDDFLKPNGLVGTPDGKRLYVTDHAAGRTYTYTIEPDSHLTKKTPFAPVGADGMTIDVQGNVYLTDPTQQALLIYSPAGRRLQTIPLPEPPSNVCFAGPDRKTLCITARSSLYTLPMTLPGFLPPTPAIDH